MFPGPIAALPMHTLHRQFFEGLPCIDHIKRWMTASALQAFVSIMQYLIYARIVHTHGWITCSVIGMCYIKKEMIAGVNRCFVLRNNIVLRYILVIQRFPVWKLPVCHK